MAFGSKKQAVIAKPSFKERLTGVKSMFKKKTSQVIEAAALSRGGTRTKAMYMATMDSVKDDVELNAVYTAYSKEVTD